MPTPSERGLKKKFRRGKKKTHVFFVRDRQGKQHCALCSGLLLGVPQNKTNSERRNLKKTEKRPSVVFGGVLCSSCRKLVWEEGVKVKIGFKKKEAVELRLNHYVDEVLPKIKVSE